MIRKIGFLLDSIQNEVDSTFRLMRQCLALEADLEINWEGFLNYISN